MEKSLKTILNVTIFMAIIVWIIYVVDILTDPLTLQQKANVYLTKIAEMQKEQLDCGTLHCINYYDGEIKGLYAEFYSLTEDRD